VKVCRSRLSEALTTLPTVQSSTLPLPPTGRAKSVAWLHGLTDPGLDRSHLRPKFGAVPARGLLGAWAAHDALHLRQILKRLYQMAQLEAGEYEVGSAGSWEECACLGGYAVSCRSPAGSDAR
jgi:hypothetical protein